ncbi:hypothetical protein [Marinomonas shanghaiensis]
MNNKHNLAFAEQTTSLARNKHASDEASHWHAFLTLGFVKHSRYRVENL